MKKKTLLLVAILAIAYTCSLSILNGSAQERLQAAYTQPGTITAHDVDYYWITGVDAGETVLLNVQAATWPSGYETVIFFSNLTVFQSQLHEDTHVYQFIAVKTDSYLLRIRAGFSFSYTIESTNHPISEQIVTTKSDSHVGFDPDYYWISVSKGSLVLLNIQTGTWPSGYESVFYYSNLTAAQPSQFHEDTHIYEFYADKTDNYLLRLHAGFSFGFTIESIQSVVEQPMNAKPATITPQDVDYFWIPNVAQGSLVLLNFQTATWPSGYETVIFYSNLTVFQNQLHEDTHVYQFYASKNDNYLLRVRAGFGFSFTMECNKPITDQPIYTKPDNYTAYSVKYHNLLNVNQGDRVLMNIQTGTWPSGYESAIFFSNLTLFQSQLHEDTHVYEFFAPKTDTYLLRIQAGFSFSYTIESTHPIDALQKNATQIVFTLSPNPATVGKAVTLQGVLTSNGNPVRNSQVAIKLGANTVGTLTTNSTGGFKASGAVSSAGTYNITVRYDGSADYLPSENWTVLVVKEITAIYSRIDPNPTSLGGSFVYEGILVNGFSQPIAGATIQLYRRTLSGSFVLLTSVTTNSYGIFRWQSTATTVGTFVYAAYYAGTDTRQASYDYDIQVVQ